MVGDMSHVILNFDL